jgi:hypothetical protein
MVSGFFRCPASFKLLELMSYFSHFRVPHMTAHVYSLVSALMLTILLSRVSAQYQGDQQYYDMDEGDLGEEEEAIIDVSHPEYLETEDEDYPQYVSHLVYILV